MMNDFADAFVCEASIKDNGVWREMTEDELNNLHSDYCYEQLLEKIF